MTVPKFVNLGSSEINIKLVYAGPNAELRAQTLDYVYGMINPKADGRLATEVMLPLGQMAGFNVRLYLHDSTGDAAFAGADAIIFVADSDPARSKDNVAALESLKVEVALLEKLPLVFQLDQRDHPHAVTVEQLSAELDVGARPAVEAIARTGVGVFEALKSATMLTMMELKGD